MKLFLVLTSVVALTCAQYDYSPPQRQFNAGAAKNDKPTYGPPNHSPGVPHGPQSVAAAPAPTSPPQDQNQGGYEHSPQPQQQPQQSHGGYQQQPQQQPQYQQQQQQAAPQPQRPQGGYQQQQAAPQRPQGGYQQQQQAQGGYEQPQEEYQPQVFRHVYVHVAPDEPEDVQSRTIKVPGGDKHVNIIFVKTPSQSSSSQTEVILPEQDEHKNLVYVLLKKGENTADIKIRKPAPAQPKKPEVYFIKYNDPQKQQGGYGAPAPQQQQSQGGYQQQQPSGIRAPGPIRSPADVPSSGYGLPL